MKLNAGLVLFVTIGSALFGCERRGFNQVIASKEEEEGKKNLWLASSGNKPTEVYFCNIEKSQGDNLQLMKQSLKEWPSGFLLSARPCGPESHRPVKLKANQSWPVCKSLTKEAIIQELGWTPTTGCVSINAEAVPLGVVIFGDESKVLEQFEWPSQAMGLLGAEALSKVAEEQKKVQDSISLDQWQVKRNDTRNQK